MNFDWSELAFESKKPLNNLRATFIAAPREVSAKRFAQFVKAYLPKGNIVLGLAKEPFIAGFEGQRQFATLQAVAVQAIINKVNAASPTHKIYTLAYFQRELVFILEKLKFQKVIFINGSWQNDFHTRAPYYTLINQHIPYELTSPFADETEAKAYAQKHEQATEPIPKGLFTTTEMMALAQKVARRSYDNGFQTGVSLGCKKGSKYECIAWAHNTVVPYQTYAWHYGASREKHFSPMHDANYYDTVHAEIALLIHVQKQGLSLHDTTLFINLLPCPSCSRMFTQTDVAEIIYLNDHSEGYGFNLLVQAGKKVTRITR